HHRYLASRMSMPAIGNFDDDPDFEIVSAGPANGTGAIYQNGKKIGYNNTGSIHLFNMDGSIVDGWPIYTQGLVFSSPVVGDIDGDGRHHIVVGLLYTAEKDIEPNLGGLYAFDADGKALPGWPVLKGKKFWAAPALTDFDYDGKLEIIASDEDFETFVISSKGVIQTGWPKITPWENFYSSLASDLDGDFIPDVGTTSGSIYTCLWDFCGGVHGWDAKGKPLPGFVKVTEVDAVAPPAAADLDNDGTLELIASSNYDYKSWEETPKNRGSLYVWSLNTPFHPDNADWPMLMHDAQRTGCYDCIKPTVSDYCIDSDGINQFYSGIVKFQKSNVKSVFKDECSEPFDSVVEKSCKKDAAGGSTVASEKIKCPTKGSCSKGRCANLLTDGNIQEKRAVNIDSMDDVSKPFRRWGLSNGAEILKGSGAAGNSIKTVSGTKTVKYGSAAIQIVDALPMKKYVVSAKARIISGYKPTLKLEFLDKQKKLLGQAVWNDDFEKKWSARNVGAISPPGTSYARVSLFSPFIRGTTGYAEWDDVVLNVE
ncbi:hypothetical protein HYU13_03600, partial [Candidatus Woesearchaeota archaeon]|nr:hypothetical protein [Candidatus Woesearchaeota archaeon]